MLQGLIIGALLYPKRHAVRNTGSRYWLRSSVARLSVVCSPIELIGYKTGWLGWARTTDILINSQTHLPTELLANKTWCAVLDSNQRLPTCKEGTLAS